MERSATDVSTERSPAPVATDRAYADLFVEHRAEVYRLAALLSGDPSVAEEITAEVFARVLPRWRRDQVSDPLAYLRRAAVNEVRSRRRRRSNERRAAARHAAQVRTSTSDDQVNPLGLDGPLVTALQALSPRHRAVVILRYHDDLPEAEVARILGSPIGTIKTQTSRALAALRKHLEDAR